MTLNVLTLTLISASIVTFSIMTMQKDTQHNNKNATIGLNNTQHYEANCHVFIFTLSLKMLSVIMLSVIMLSVIMLVSLC
jgi:hypothetical protein